MKRASCSCSSGVALRASPSICCIRRMAVSCRRRAISSRRRDGGARRAGNSAQENDRRGSRSVFLGSAIVSSVGSPKRETGIERRTSQCSGRWCRRAAGSSGRWVSSLVRGPFGRARSRGAAGRRRRDRARVVEGRGGRAQAGRIRRPRPRRRLDGCASSAASCSSSPLAMLDGARGSIRRSDWRRQRRERFALVVP